MRFLGWGEVGLVGVRFFGGLCVDLVFVVCRELLVLGIFWE